MEIKERITLDRLTKDSVSVLRQKFVVIDGTEMQVGGNVRLNQPFQLGQIDFRMILPEREHEAVMHVVVHAAVHQLRRHVHFA